MSGSARTNDRLHQIRVRRATQSDLEAAALILAEAFAAYPWTQWSIPADGYAIRLEELQRLYLAHALAHGLVFVDENLKSVSAFMPPDAPSVEADVAERIGLLHGDRLTDLMKIPLPAGPEHSWILATVGVCPDAQGLGLGSAVLAAGLHKLDEESAAVALETSDERNVRLYQRHGFSLDATTAVPAGPLVYSMSRPARE